MPCHVHGTKEASHVTDTGGIPHLIVHRDLGPDFKHVTDGSPCPCEPHFFHANDPRSSEEIIAAIDAAERRH
ncbi:hypothetical protein [Microcystis phage Mwe-JY26]